ncbi:hypothetical protein CDL15_Pgr006090 [Punica granatum]|uniref:Uncharacterized protein n=1 Tax=Punica granatum TaxID=22663 RepID=A0A218VUE0_PUNGR|nr:hypothetical protein CDL15_Pgr006090 [Punica granatum]PKI68115.1 hypothetical protein CRG98_011711 [Punica granatum]
MGGDPHHPILREIDALEFQQAIRLLVLSISLDVEILEIELQTKENGVPKWIAGQGVEKGEDLEHINIRLRQVVNFNWMEATDQIHATSGIKT